MTISQIIDQLADLGQTIGLDANVKGWNVSEHPLEPLGVRSVVDVSAGWDSNTKAPIATLRMS